MQGDGTYKKNLFVDGRIGKRRGLENFTVERREESG